MVSVTLKKIRRHDDQGSSLILAMIFMVVCSLSVLGLSAAAANDLNNVAKFSGARTLHTAESSTMDKALYLDRYTPTTCPVPPKVQSTPVNLFIDNLSIDVWCTTVSTPSTNPSRQVTFYACPDSAIPANNSYSYCSDPAHANLTVVAQFNDYATTYTAPRSSLCTVNCGDAMTVTSWVFR